MKAVLASVGSRGDIQPLAILARALLARGHEVVLMGPPEGRALAHDVEYVECGRDMMAWLQSFDVSTIGVRALFAAVKDLVDKDTAASAPLLVEAARGADVVVTAGLQMLGGIAAEMNGAAFTYFYFSPLLLPSDEHPPMVVELQRLPKLANRTLHNVTIGFFNRIVLPPLNRERRKLNLVPHRTVVDVMPLDLTLAYDALLAPPPGDLDVMWARHDVEPRRVHQVGAMVPAQAPLDDDLARFVERGRSAYVGFGSMPDQGPDATLALVDAAARIAGVNVVMLGKGAGTERVKLVASAAHASLFPKMAAVVHHGGCGTTATAARAGAPQVVVPHFVDQPYWAHRLALAGVSAGTIRRRDLRAENLAAALTRALDDTALQTRARALAEKLNANDTAAAAADHIEALARAR